MIKVVRNVPIDISEHMVKQRRASGFKDKATLLDYYMQRFQRNVEKYGTSSMKIQIHKYLQTYQPGVTATFGQFRNIEKRVAKVFAYQAKVMDVSQAQFLAYLVLTY